MIESDNRRSLVDLKTWARETTNLEWKPGSVPPSRIPRPNNVQIPMQFPKDRIRTVIVPDSGHFDSDYWGDRRDFPIKRLGMFARFLEDNNLIGMSKDKVAVLLGESERPRTPVQTDDFFTYIFPMYSCMGEHDCIKIYFQNESVSSWSFFRVRAASGFKESEHITSDVVLKSWKIAGDDETFPEVVEKEIDFSDTVKRIEKSH